MIEKTREAERRKISAFAAARGLDETQSFVEMVCAVEPTLRRLSKEKIRELARNTDGVAGRVPGHLEMQLSSLTLTERQRFDSVLRSVRHCIASAFESGVYAPVRYRICAAIWMGDSCGTMPPIAVDVTPSGAAYRFGGMPVVTTDE